MFGSVKENLGLAVSKNNMSNKKPALNSKAYLYKMPSVLTECFGSLFVVSHVQQRTRRWDSEVVLVRWPWNVILHQSHIQTDVVPPCLYETRKEWVRLFEVQVLC